MNARNGPSGRLQGVIIVLAAVVLFTILPGSVPAQAASFSDIQGSTYAAYISYLGNRQVIEGYPDGTYKPEQSISRAEAATMMVKGMKLDCSDISGPSPFTDVSLDSWAYPYILAGYRAGYVHGAGDGTFSPDDLISRSEALTLVLNLSKQSKSQAVLPLFLDLPSGHWAAESVATALAAGMYTTSPGNEYFYPEQPFLRGEMARAFAVLLTTDPDFYCDEMQGKVSKFSGEVNLMRNGASVALADGTTIMAGDYLTTGKNSYINVSYPDGSAIKLESDSSLSVDKSRGRMIINSDGSSSQVVEELRYHLPVGDMYTALASSHDLDSSSGGASTPWYERKGSWYTKIWIDMPWGVAAIEGTFARTLVLPATSCEMSCLIGSARLLTSEQDIAGVQVVPGSSSFIRRFGDSASAPAAMSNLQMQAWIDRSQWVIDVAGDIAVQGQLREQNALDENLPALNAEFNQLQGLMQNQLDQLENGTLMQEHQELLGRFSREWSTGDSAYIPRGITMDGSGALWTVLDGSTGFRIRKYDMNGVQNGELYSYQQSYDMQDIAIGIDGRILVTDAENGQVLSVLLPAGFDFASVAANPAASPTAAAPLPYTWENLITGLQEPCGIDVSPDGTIYVADRAAGTVTKYDSNGLAMPFVHDFSRMPSEYILVNSPDGLEVDRSGNIFITSSQAGCIYEFNSSGDQLNRWTINSDGSEVSGPFGIDTDSNGDIYISDRNNDRIQVFRPDLENGDLARRYSFGELGRSQGNFNYPWGIAVQNAQTIFVVDSGNRRIQVISE